LEELPAPLSLAVAGVYVAGKISYIIFYCHEDRRNKTLRMIIKRLPVNAASYSRRL
jgi:hypothetical protein